MSETITLVTTKPDAETAADLKARAEQALGPVMALMAEAAQHKMLIEWQGIGPDAFGRFHVNGLRVVKHY